MKELKSSKAVADVNVDTYDAIYVPGKFYVPPDKSPSWTDWMWKCVYLAGGHWHHCGHHGKAWRCLAQADMAL